MSGVVEITPGLLAEHPLPDAAGGSHKDGHGRVLLIGAPAGLAGAALLAGTAALRAGAGKLQIAAPEAYAVALALAIPEALVIPVPVGAGGEVSPDAPPPVEDAARRADALVIGPGMMDRSVAAALVRALLRAAPEPRVVLDAAALTGLGDLDDARALCGGRAVLTPHSGEAAALLDRDVETVRADPAEAARELARRFSAVAAVKDRQTLVAAPDGRVWRNGAGAQGLGVSGSGDVLAGLIGGLLARGVPPEGAAIRGVYAHAQAGRRLSATLAPRGFLARELLDVLPVVLAEAALEP